MKFLVAVCLALAAQATARPRPGEKYTDRFDNINVEEILANQRLFRPYVKCLLDEGRCPPEGAEFKLHMREAIEDNCARCTDAQKQGRLRVIEYLINNDVPAWERIMAKYDPNNTHKTKFEEQFRAAKPEDTEATTSA